MTLGTGWCFGGPMIPDGLANASVKYKVEKVTGPTEVQYKVNPAVQAVVAYGPNGQTVELTDKIADGQVKWSAPQGDWQIYELWQQPSGRKVKRAAPGGQGHMLNPFSKEATETFLKEFDKAFSGYKGRMPRAIYHDSYEYVCNWSWICSASSRNAGAIDCRIICRRYWIKCRSAACFTHQGRLSLDDFRDDDR
jgi:hypothetical protein